MKRCAWIEGKDKLYTEYHDKEWGTPVYDDDTLYEMLILECFQAGLSWYTILAKREHFRSAFDNFDIDKVINYDDKKIEELLNNKNIIRNKLKIKAAINNSIVFKSIQEEFGTFSKYIWGFTEGEIVYNFNGELVATTPLSDKVSLDLKRRGMKFVGSVTIYSYLQAVGIVNDHDPECFRYKELLK